MPAVKYEQVLICSYLLQAEPERVLVLSRQHTSRNNSCSVVIDKAGLLHSITSSVAVAVAAARSLLPCAWKVLLFRNADQEQG